MIIVSFLAMVKELFTPQAMALSTNNIKKTVLFHFLKVFNHSILMKLPGILKKKCKPLNSRIRVLFLKKIMIMLM